MTRRVTILSTAAAAAIAVLGVATLSSDSSPARAASKPATAATDPTTVTITVTGMDFPGPCDEAENADDARCAGVSAATVGQRGDGRGRDAGDDRRGGHGRGEDRRGPNPGPG